MHNKMLTILLLANVFVLIQSISVIVRDNGIVNTTTAPSVNPDDKTNGLDRNGYSRCYFVVIFFHYSIFFWGVEGAGILQTYLREEERREILEYYFLQNESLTNLKIK